MSNLLPVARNYPSAPPAAFDINTNAVDEDDAFDYRGPRSTRERYSSMEFRTNDEEEDYLYSQPAPEQRSSSDALVSQRPRNPFDALGFSTNPERDATDGLLNFDRPQRYDNARSRSPPRYSNNCDQGPRSDYAGRPPQNRAQYFSDSNLIDANARSSRDEAGEREARECQRAQHRQETDELLFQDRPKLVFEPKSGPSVLNSDYAKQVSHLPPAHGMPKMLKKSGVGGGHASTDDASDEKRKEIALRIVRHFLVSRC